VPGTQHQKGVYEMVLCEDEPYREAHLLYKPMSINRMIKKTKNKEYSTISEFITDAKTFVHNVKGFHFGL